MILMKKLKNTMQMKNRKYWLYLMICLLSNNKLNPIAAELFIKGRKLIISLVFITQSYFVVPKCIRLNSPHYFVMKIPNKRELNKMHLIIHWIFTFKTSWIFINSVLQNHILFWLLIIHLHQMILHVSERIF